MTLYLPADTYATFQAQNQAAQVQGDQEDLHNHVMGLLQGGDAPTPSDSLTNPTLNDQPAAATGDSVAPPLAPDPAAGLPAPSDPVTAPLQAPQAVTGSPGGYQSALDWGTKQLGKGYVWGSAGGRSDLSGTSPGYDCSGFVSQFYHQMGLSVPAQTAAAYAATAPLSEKDAQPGDLVEFNMGSNDPHQQHIAVYLGNGKVMQSGGLQGNVNIGNVNQFGAGTYEFRRASGFQSTQQDSAATSTVASAAGAAPSPTAPSTDATPAAPTDQSPVDALKDHVTTLLNGGMQSLDSGIQTLGGAKDDLLSHVQGLLGGAAAGASTMQAGQQSQTAGITQAANAVGSTLDNTAGAALQPVSDFAQGGGVAGLLTNQGLLKSAADPNVTNDQLAQHAIMALSAGANGEGSSPAIADLQGWLQRAAAHPEVSPQLIAAKQTQLDALLHPDSYYPGTLEPKPPGTPPEVSTAPVEAPAAPTPVETPNTVGSSAPPPPELPPVSGAPPPIEPPTPPTAGAPTPGSPSLGDIAWGAMAEGKKSIFSLTNVHAMNIARGLSTSQAGPGAALKFAQAYGKAIVSGVQEHPEVTAAIGQATNDGVQFFSHSPETGGAAAGVNPLLIKAAQAGLGGVTSATSTYGISKAAGASDEDALRNAVVGGAIGAITGPTLAIRMHDALWKDAVPLAKVMTWQAAKDGGLSGAEAAKFSNNLNGGQGLSQVAGSKPMQDLARLIVQSPDWLMSQLKLTRDAAIGTAKTVVDPGSLSSLANGKMNSTAMTGSQQASRDWLIKQLMVYGFATEALQKALTGHFTDQNSPGHEFVVEVPNTNSKGKGDNITASLFDGNLQQVLDAAAKHDPGATAAGKLNPWVSTPIEEMVNKQYLGANAPAIYKPADDALTQKEKQAQFAVSKFAPLGVTSPQQEYYAGAPVPVIAASALTGIPMSHNSGGSAGAPAPGRAPVRSSPLPRVPSRAGAPRPISRP